jgi:hypothetical protein
MSQIRHLPDCCTVFARSQQWGGGQFSATYHTPNWVIWIPTALESSHATARTDSAIGAERMPVAPP